MLSIGFFCIARQVQHRLQQIYRYYLLLASRPGLSWYDGTSLLDFVEILLLYRNSIVMLCYNDIDVLLLCLCDTERYVGIQRCNLM